MKKTVITAIITTMVLSVSVLGQPNLIVNGDFEASEASPTFPDQPTGTWSYYVTTLLGGWNIAHTFPTGNEYDPTLEIWDNLMGPAYSGDQHVELDSTDPTKISQVVSTIPGSQYELSYAWGPRPDITDNQMQVLIDGVEVAYHSASGGSQPISWTHETYPLTATSSSTAIAFAEVGEDNECGMLLDAVSLVLVEIAVDIDIKPGSCPNPLNVKSKGVLPVAILGSEEFDVFTIDVASIRLEGVAPIRSSYEDVATPVPDGAEICECTTEGPDGYLDLTLKFKVQEIVAALGEVNDGEEFELTLTGALAEALGETPIEGKDCVVIIDNTKAIITSVVRDGVTEGQPTIVAGPSPGGLQEGSHAFMDRPIDEDDTRNYHWESIPAKLVGADYVMTYNEDCKPWYDPEAYNVSYSVTLGQAAKLYIFVDDRYAPFAWLTDGSAGAVFADTGLDIELNELGGSGVLQPFNVYGAKVSAGTYILGPSCDGDVSRNFYSIAVAKK